MIKFIKLSNFQSHRDSTLDFVPGVNVVLGASDSGKTALIRAIRWIAFHKPAGDEMRSHWGGKTRVELTTDDCTVVKSKDKEQEYILGDMHFKAFGTEVPDEIAKALNMSSQNVQLQLDQPFLLSETPGNVALHFNSIAGLSKIDTGLQKINSSIRELTADIKYAEGQEISLTEGLDKFKHLEMFETDVEVLEEMGKQLVTKCHQLNKLETILSTYQINGETILEYNEILDLEKPLEQIFKWKDERELAITDKALLETLINRIKRNERSQEEYQQLLLVETSVNNLLKLYKEREMAVNEQKRLAKVLTSLNGINDRITKGGAYIALKQVEFENAMGSVCILCGQKIIK